jgi:methionyl-tRNA formyltransferase
MSQTSRKRIVFFGTPQFAVPFLTALYAESEIEVVGVVTQPDRPRGRGNKVSPSPIKSLALTHNTKVLTPPSPKSDDEFVRQLYSLKADAFVVLAYGHILPKKVLEMPHYGSVNVHPSLLPEHRGPSPMQATLLNGDSKSGVTIMLMDEKMDHGPILTQEHFTIPVNANYQVIERTVHKIGPKLLTETLLGYFKGDIEPTEQDHNEATYCKLINKTDAELKHTMTTQEALGIIRAYSSWPISYLLLPGNLRLQILEAELAETFPSKDLVLEETPILRFANGGIRILSGKLPGKSTMTGPQLAQTLDATLKAQTQLP